MTVPLWLQLGLLIATPLPVRDLQVVSPTRLGLARDETRTFSCSAPRFQQGPGCRNGADAHSDMTIELWAQPRRSVWVPDDPVVWAAQWQPYMIAASAPVRPGQTVTFVVPRPPAGTTVWAQARNQNGLSECVGNPVP